MPEQLSRIQVLRKVMIYHPFEGQNFEVFLHIWKYPNKALQKCGVQIVLFGREQSPVDWGSILQSPQGGKQDCPQKNLQARPYFSSANQRSASIAAWQPIPAAVMA